VDEDKTSVFSKDDCHIVDICSTNQNSWVILVRYLKTTRTGLITRPGTATLCDFSSRLVFK
jgi:hypothetical protein